MTAALAEPQVQPQPGPQAPEEEIPFTLVARRMRTPKWSHGSLIAVLHHDTLDPQIWLIEPLRQRTAQFTVPGARRIRIADWDRGGGGDSTLGLAGAAEYADGRAAGFIAWISLDDPTAPPTIVETARYVPAKVAVAPDGTIWTSGAKAPPVSAAENVIRHFDRSGKLLGSFLPQAAIGDPTTLAGVQTALRVSRDRVAWCSARDKDIRLVEISLNGGVLTDTIVSPPSGGQPIRYITGFAIQDEDAGGGVFVSGTWWTNETARAKEGSGERYGVFAVDRARRTWKALPVGDPFAGVYGVEGDRLVLSGEKRIRFRKIDSGF